MNRYSIKLLSIVLVGLMLVGCTIVGEFKPDPKPNLYGQVVGWVYASLPVGPQGLGEEFELDMIVSAEYYAPEGYRPLPGARVTLTDSTNRISEVSSGSDGGFTFSQVREGWVTISITHRDLHNITPIVKQIFVEGGKPNFINPAGKVGVGYYILVGINKYLHKMVGADFEFSSKDVRDISYVLSRGDTKMGDYKEITNTYATKSAIRDAITSACNAANPEDFLVFYFSGYGGTNIYYNTYYDRILHRNADYIVPYDGKNYGNDGLKSVITDKDLATWFSDFPGRDITVILDAGYSGSFINGQSIGRQSFEIEMQALQQPGYTVLTATKDDQASAVGPDNSVLAMFIQPALQLRSGYMGADFNRDSTVTALELYEYVSQEIKRMWVEEGINIEMPEPKLYPERSNTVILRR